MCGADPFPGGQPWSLRLFVQVAGGQESDDGVPRRHGRAVEQVAQRRCRQPLTLGSRRPVQLGVGPGAAQQTQRPGQLRQGLHRAWVNPRRVTSRRASTHPADPLPPTCSARPRRTPPNQRRRPEPGRRFVAAQPVRAGPRGVRVPPDPMPYPQHCRCYGRRPTGDPAGSSRINQETGDDHKRPPR